MNSEQLNKLIRAKAHHIVTNKTCILTSRLCKKSQIDMLQVECCRLIWYSMFKALQLMEERGHVSRGFLGHELNLGEG